MSASSDRCLQTPNQSDTPKDTRIKPTNREWKTFYFVTFPLLRCGSIFLPPTIAECPFHIFNTADCGQTVVHHPATPPLRYSCQRPPPKVKSVLPGGTKNHSSTKNWLRLGRRRFGRAGKVGSFQFILPFIVCELEVLKGRTVRGLLESRRGGERGWWVLNLAVTGGPSLAGFKRRPLVWASPVFVKIALVLFFFSDFRFDYSEN